MATINNVSARHGPGTHPGVMLFGGWVYDCANWPPTADVGRISINTRVPMTSTSPQITHPPVNDLSLKLPVSHLLMDNLHLHLWGRISFVFTTGFWHQIRLFDSGVWKRIWFADWQKFPD